MSINMFCFDFDGVISNSMEECMLMTWNAYHDEIVDHPDKLDAEYADFFRKSRYLVRDPGEYFILVDSYINKIKVTPTVFDELLEINVDIRTAFKNKFFEKRQFLRNQNVNGWLSMQPCYQQAVDFILNSTLPIYIVTTKDEYSVERLLELYGIRDKIVDILGQSVLKDVGGKHRGVRMAAEAAGVSLENTVFIDDHPLHLSDVAGDGIQLYFAAWGYTPKNMDLSCLPQSCGILTLDNLTTSFQ